MTPFDRPNFLRTVLGIDAVACTLMGLGLIADGGAIAAVGDLPETLMITAGAGLLPVALFIAVVMTRRPIPTAGVWIVIAGNLGWVTASIALFPAGAIAPNLAGTLLVFVQAVAVLVLAGLEYLGLRRQGRSAPA